MLTDRGRRKRPLEAVLRSATLAHKRSEKVREAQRIMAKAIKHLKVMRDDTVDNGIIPFLD
jgi:hypothetical protein